MPWGRECWQQLGRTTLQVNGAAVPVSVFASTYDGLAGNAYAGGTTLYYDATRQMFLKGDAVNRRGTVMRSWVRSFTG